MPKTSESAERLHFLGQLITRLHYSSILYTEYIKHNTRYLNALIIKNNNLKMKDLILTHSHHLPRSLEVHTLAIAYHIDAWLVCWDRHSELKSPSLDDPFYFNNDVNFPKASEQAILNYYQAIIEPNP